MAGKGDIVKGALDFTAKLLSGEGDEAAKAGIRAYHGSPHSFDKFSMSKLGTGEGAQAYGHGLYFAENEDVAKGYRRALSGPESMGTVTFDGRTLIDKGSPAEAWSDPSLNIIGDLHARDLTPDLLNYGSVPDAISGFRSKSKDYANRVDAIKDEKLRGITDRGAKAYSDMANFLEANPDRYSVKIPGHMYEVNIAANPNADFINYDAPWSEQPQKVKDAFHYLSKNQPDGSDLARRIEAPIFAQEASDRGVKGIQFLDAGSRGAGDGTRNYVVFDDKLISIVRKYGIAGASAMLGYNLMEQLDPKQALAATMADEEYRVGKAGGGSVREGYSGKGRVIGDVVDQALKLVMGEGENAAKTGIKAYHVSPHDFDKFEWSPRTSKTGEGNQSYGAGLYFAENPSVSGRGGDYWRQFFNKMKSGPERTAAGAMFANKFELEKAINALESGSKYHVDRAIPGRYGDGPEIELGHKLLADEAQQALEILRSGQIAGPRTYEVDINASPDALIDWDKPATMQSDRVLSAVKPFYESIPDRKQYGETFTGGDLYRDFINRSGGVKHGPKIDAAGIPNQLPGGIEERATQYLTSKGIPGLQYLDGVSRRYGDGTRNYVIFDDKRVDIKDKYAEGGEVDPYADEVARAKAAMAEKQYDDQSWGDWAGDAVGNALNTAKAILPTALGGEGSVGVSDIARGAYEGAKDAVTFPGDVISGKQPLYDESGRPLESAVGRSFNTVGAVGGASSLVPVPDNSLRVFGGIKSKTADKNALTKAQIMESRGASPDDIWRQTGWGRGTDDQWRYEIPDIGTTVDPSQFKPNMSSASLHSEANLSDYLNHPELIAAYPEFSKMKVTEFGNNKNLYGYYMPRSVIGNVNDPWIGMNTQLLNTPELQRNTMLHEVQHAIQQKEGFAPGSNIGRFAPDTIPNPRRKIYDEAMTNDPELQEFTSLLEDPNYKKEIAESNKLFDETVYPRILNIQHRQKMTGEDLYNETGAILDEHRKNSRKLFPLIGRLDDLGDSLRKRKIPMQPPEEFLTPEQAYLQTAGEVEARNVQERRNMVPAGLKQLPPWETQEYPREIQLIDWNDTSWRKGYAEGGSVEDEDSWLDSAMTLARNAADKATFGTAKYAAAGADYLTDAALDAVGYENDADFDRALAEQEYAMKEGEEKNPAAAGAGDVLGYVAPYLAIGPAEGALSTLGYLSDYGSKVGRTGSLFARALGYADGGEVDDDIYHAVRLSRDIGGATNENPQVMMTDANGVQYDATGKVIQTADPQANSNSSAAPSQTTPEEVGRRAAEDPATFDAMMERYAVPDRDIVDYEALKKEVSQQPQQVQQMTHVGAPPMRDIKVDMPLFGGEYNAGQAPYDIANPMSGVAQAAYDMKTVPLYFTPWTAPIGAGMDVAEGVATGDPLTASLAIGFGPGGKMAKAAGIGAANYFIDPSEAEAGPARWFSKAMEVASALPMEKMTGQQALAMLRKGTSPEELKWTGAEKFLSSRPQVSKSELVEYLNNNRIQVNEVTLGGNKPWDEMDVVVDPDIMAEFQPKIDEYAEEVRQLRDQQKAMDSPDQSVTYGDRSKIANAVAYAQQKLWFVKEAARKKQIERMGGLSKKPKYQSYSTPGGEGYRENLYTLGLGKKTYKSSHWDDPDVLFHTRSQTLSYDPPGANRPYRVHNVDETQSDWGQGVRKHGMKDPANNWRTRYDEAVKKNTDDWVEQKATAAFEAAPHAYDNDIEEARAWARRYAQTFGASKISQQLGRHQEYLDLYNAMNREGEAMPAGPFVGGTEGWTDRSIKQELDKALDSDADYFSWSPGEVHADRYDLSKHIGRIDYNPDDGSFLAYNPDGKMVINESISDPSDLDNYVGKELADKIRAEEESRRYSYNEYSIDKDEETGKWEISLYGEPSSDSIGPLSFTSKGHAKDYLNQMMADEFAQNPVSLSGLDLKVGGEGMKGYYDKVYLKRIQDVIKKATGEKPEIEVIEVQTADGPRKQLGIKLTDEMREKARFSDFNRGGTVTAPNSYGNDDPAVSRAIALTREY